MRLGTVERMTSVTALSGSLHSPSKTRALLDAILAALQPDEATVIEVTQLDGLGTAFGRGPLPDAVAAAVEAIASADLVVVATPVYRGSYTGLLKHLIDLVPQDALRGTPVLLAATGGSDEHSLVIDHELRPLFSFFGALTLPTGVYARDGDFVDGAVASEVLQGRIAAAVESAGRWR